MLLFIEMLQFNSHQVFEQSTFSTGNYCPNVLTAWTGIWFIYETKL